MFKLKSSILGLLAFAALSSFGQNSDLTGQFQVVKDLIPASTRLGVLYNPGTPNIEALISNASASSGLLAVKAPVKSARDMTPAIRSLAKYKVDFIIMIDDKTVTGAQSIKFVVKQTMRGKVPVFTASPNASKGGAYGQLVLNGNAWQVKINSKVKDRFNIAIPDDGRFVLED